MTHIEQAIRDAVEKGGWYDGYKIVAVDDKDNFLLALNGTIEIFVSYQAAFLDPSFWQALGRARDWDVYSEHDYKLHAVTFMRHLMDGKDAESFFVSLV